MLRLARLCALTLFALAGVLMLSYVLSTLNLPDAERKDFTQDYLMARAVLDGVNPYLPMPELGAWYGYRILPWPHPTPHPPTFAFLCVPLGLLTLVQACAVWEAVGLAALVASLRLIFRTRVLPTVGLTLLALCWRGGFYADILTGQLMTPILLLLTLAWLRLREGKDVSGGLLLGLSMAVKPLAWPVVLYLLLKGRMRAVLCAAACVAALNLAAVGVMGWRAVYYYYSRVGGEVSRIYRGDAVNFSAWAVGPKLFEGTYMANPGPTLSAPPPVELPALSTPASAICVLAVLGLALYVALRAGDFDVSYAALVCAASVLSPVAWPTYLVLLVLPLGVASARRGRHLGLVVALAGAGSVTFNVLAALFGPSGPAAVGPLSLLPLAAPLALIVCLARPGLAAGRAPGV